ncbi:hypothetical protein, conserved [Trypanosoma brucei gambiense DAL972]|uniref:Uncharacterized protein n=1 Tax=Trypanosoma brucei gambiense (strain MHOM/CI/86/DAL972) TaxID=679716 RepID=D0A7D6_TRYB9|nr:hypothetical protein, conserved [Trypanosoma brucei gambiense DAL972]CBH17587.1 hypothetical protein, conserved [Trypanosoma brucei gambiense DAL972]|eukprot:XP_011779851.1 hypothetical protein, conserved [Trypanosoma brucei gambiense DAL972]
MPKQLTFISAGATAAVLQSASAIVSKVAGGRVQTKTAKEAGRHAVVVGPETPIGVHTAVTEVPKSAQDPLFSGVSTVVVRAVLPRAAPDSVQLRDALDVYASAGIDTKEEVRSATEAFKKSAEVAVGKAKAKGVKRIVLVVKQASKHNCINELFKKISTETIESAGLTTEVVGTAVVANQLIVNPESLGVVLLNDVAATEQIELAFAGVVGGVSRVYHTVEGGKISAGHSFKSVALAVAQELRELGLSSEADKVEAAASKNPRAVVSAL